jgi:hypothetical protein
MQPIIAPDQLSLALVTVLVVLARLSRLLRVHPQRLVAIWTCKVAQLLPA